MAPLIPSAKVTLQYPLFTSEFDPLDSSRLFVAGGGGAGRSGVPNRITIFDTSKSEEIIESGEIDLSKQEDSVTSIAVGQKVDNSTPLFAGVNSSAKDIAANKNKHFRVFKVDDVSGSSEKGHTHKITEALRTKVFVGADTDLYQRVTRLSKPYKGQSQIGAITTGLAKQSELLIFDAGGKTPGAFAGWQSNKETVDLDFIQIGEDEYYFAVADDSDIYLSKIVKGKTPEEEPKVIYASPDRNAYGQFKIPTIKGLRWLTREYFTILTNEADSGGVKVHILRLPPSGEGHAAIVQSIKLPGSVSKATGFAVANLTAPVKPLDPQGYTQFVIAVAGHDISISLFKIDLQESAGVRLVTKIKPFRTFKKVHPIQITSLALSSFTPPIGPITAHTPQQYLKLASTSMSNTVVVHSIPLFPVPLSVKRGQSKIPRYVVALPSKGFAFGTIVIATILIALLSVFVESFIEIRGGPPSRIGGTKYIPIKWQYALGKQYEFPPGYSASLNTPAPTSAFSTSLDTPSATVVPVGAEEVDNSGLNLQDLVAAAQAGGSDGVVILKDVEGEQSVQAHLHDEEAHGAASPKAKKWEDLPPKVKEGWKKKLSDAGHWAEDLPETLFKGVLFGELAGAVGRAVAGG